MPASWPADILKDRPVVAFPGSGQAAECSPTAEDFAPELRSRLDDTVRAHRIADVPVGAFLSGGLDSSAIVALMMREGGTRLKTFSIVFEEAAYSEAGPARFAADALGTEHHETLLTGRQVATDLDRLIHAFDQPTGDGINTYYVSQAARAGGVTVALSGLGGDELFGGYPSFRDLPRIARWLAWWRLLPSLVRTAVAQRLSRGGVRQRKLADFLLHARNLSDLCSSSGVCSPQRWALPFASGRARPAWTSSRATRPSPVCLQNWTARIRSKPSAHGNSARTWPTCSCATAM